MKKIISIILSVLLLCCLGLTLTACGDKAGEEVLFTLSDETRSLELYDTFNLLRDANGETIKWESSDDNICSVENGVVEALAIGEATITAKGTSGTKSCVVTVVPTTKIPSLTIDKKNVTAREGDSFTAYTNITLRNKVLTETVTWKSSDTTVATVDNNGKVTAVKEGEATITATSTCKGEIIYDTMKVNVIKDVSVNIGDVSIYNLTLYTNDYLNPGQTTHTIEPFVKSNGADYSATFTYESEDSKIASVSAGGKIDALSEGKTVIKISTNVNGVDYQESINVEVIKSVEEIVEEDFEVYSGVGTGSNRNTATPNIYDIDLTNYNLTAEDKETRMAYFINGEKTVNVSRVSLSNVTPNDQNRARISGSYLGSTNYGKDISLIFETTTVKIKVKFNNVVTKYIDEKADLDNMLIYGGVNVGVKGMPYNGYFVLTNDIDLENNVIKNRVAGTNFTYEGGTKDVYYANDAKDPVTGEVTKKAIDTRKYGFAGTFEGNGYTISGLRITENNGGLFGNVSEDGIVKNLGVNAVFAQYEKSLTPGSADHSSVFGDYFIGTMNNCYVSVSFEEGSGNSTYNGIARSVARATISELVVKVDASNRVGGYVNALGYKMNDWPSYWDSKVVPNNISVFASDSYVTVGSYGYNWEASNVATTRYSFYDKTAVSFMDSDYWDLTGDQPIFKTAGKPLNIFDIEKGEPFTVCAGVNKGELSYNTFTADLSEQLEGVSGVEEIRFTSENFSVKVDKYELEGGILTVNGSELGAKVYGNASITIKTTDRDYMISSFDFITMNLSTKEDLENLLVYGEVDEKLSYGGYFVLAKDIEVNGLLANRVIGTNVLDSLIRPNGSTSSEADATGVAGFRGIFDGNGHAIIGLEVEEGNGGLFGNVGRDAIIKNLALSKAKFIQSNNGRAYVSLFGGAVCGELSNIYVEASFEEGKGSANYSILGRNIAYSKLTDVVFKYDLTNFDGGKMFGLGYMINNWPDYWSSKSTYDNLYIFSTNEELKMAGYAFETPYTNAETKVIEFPGLTLLAYDAEITFEPKDSSFWNLTGKQPIFLSLAPIEEPGEGNIQEPAE